MRAEPVSREMIVRLVRELHQIPEHIRELAIVHNKLEKQLLLCQDDKETTKIEENLSLTDQELEWLRGRQTATVTTINLVAALTNAGRMEEVQSVLAVLEDKQNKQQKSEKNRNWEDDLKTGVFTVKEAKPGKSEGTVWAVAVSEAGAENKICSKNGNGKKLLESVNKQIKIKYRPIKDDKLFAVSVELQ